MGYVSGKYFEKGATFLLAWLIESGRKSFTLSEFYDGTTETEEKLNILLGLTPEDESGMLYIDFGVDQLENDGLIKKTVLNQILADGEFDYKVTLLDNGIELFIDGYLPKCDGIYL